MTDMGWMLRETARRIQYMSVHGFLNWTNPIQNTYLERLILSESGRKALNKASATAGVRAGRRRSLGCASRARNRRTTWRRARHACPYRHSAAATPPLANGGGARTPP